MQEAAQVQRQQLVRQTSLADIQQQVVGAEQGVNIAELQANAQVKHATGEAEAVRLRAHGEAEAIRATGTAKAEAYRAGVESLGSQAYTVMQLMQIVGDRNVRFHPFRMMAEETLEYLGVSAVCPVVWKPGGPRKLQRAAGLASGQP